jgi:hypothetical protein
VTSTKSVRCDINPTYLKHSILGFSCKEMQSRL